MKTVGQDLTEHHPGLDTRHYDSLAFVVASDLLEASFAFAPTSDVSYRIQLVFEFIVLH